MKGTLPKIIMFALMAIGILSFVMVFTSESYDFMIYVMYAFFGICCVVSVLAALAGTASNPKGIKGTLIGFIALAAVLGVSYVMASGEVLESYGNVSETSSKLSGAGLYAFYILFGISVVTIIGSSVKNLIK